MANLFRFIQTRSRRALGAVRQTALPNVVFANRLNAVVRYVLDLVLWSRLFTRTSELSKYSDALRDRGIDHSAPTLYRSGPPDEATIWEEAFADVYRTLLANLQSPDLISQFRYGHPAPAFQGLYLWDSAFIAQVWKPWDPSVGIDCCRAVISGQTDDGRLPHVTAHFTKSPFTQPPLIAWSLRRLCDWLPPPRARETIEEAYPKLVRYHAWLRKHRMLPSGLFYWQHPYESGVENAPRFSDRAERILADTTRLAAPDLSTYVLLQLESLASMASTLGHDADAEDFRTKHAALASRIESDLWHEEDGLYYDRHADNGDFVRSRTIASLIPLWAGTTPKERADRLAALATDPAAFGTLIPLPSVARNDPDFAKDMWRGSTWINTAYAVILGLERAGYLEEAADLALRLVEGVYRTHRNKHRFYEFYDPERHDVSELHRKKGNLWKHITLGSKPRAEFVGWTGLVNTLAIENLVGLTMEDGRAVLRPRMPRAMAGHSLALRVPSLGIAIEAETLDGEIYGTIRQDAAVRRFHLRFGQRAYVDTLPVERPAGVTRAADLDPTRQEVSHADL